MTEWVPVGGDFIKADVVRWKEGVFERRGPRGRRAINIGNRLVIAEVLTEPDAEGWVLLLVIGFEVRVGSSGQEARADKERHENEAQAENAGAGGGRSGFAGATSACRSMLASRFLGNRKPVSDMSDEEDIYES